MMDQGFEYITIRDIDADSSEQVLDKVCDRLLKKGIVYDSFREAVKEREQKYPTGIKTRRYGIAIPHVEPQHVIKNALCVVTLRQPVVFREMGGTGQVNVECLLVIMLNAYDDHHMKTMARAMNILQNVEDLDNIRTFVSSDEIQKLFKKYVETGS